MKLRIRLFQLVAGTVVPLVLLAIALGAVLATQQQETYRDSALARMRALMTAVDAQLRGHLRAAAALGASRSLTQGDLESFYLDAERVLSSQSDWENITLAAPNGDQMMNLARPFGTRLTSTADITSFREVVDSLQPAVGNVFVGENTSAYGVPVRVPVFDASRDLAYVLTAVIDPSTFGELIQSQDLPPSWVSGLIDGTGHFVGRVPALPHTEVASEDFLTAVRGSEEGWYRGLTIERVDTYTAFKGSGVSGWSIGIAIPASVVNAGARNAAWIIVLGTLFSVAIALSFAYVQGRRIAHPISRLSAAARAIGDGKAPGGLGTAEGIYEVREVARALNETAQAIGERHALLEREQSALREADRAKDEFLAMLGHELRNPLSAIAAATQVLSVAEPGGEMAVQSRAIIERQARQMTRLIEDLLDVSGVTMGRVSLRRKPFDLARLAGHVVRTWERSDALRQSTVTIEAEEVWVDGDRARIEQVLANLLENASKFSPSGAPIRVCIRNEGTTAVLEVIDQGEGIAPDRLDHVFGLFVQDAPGPARARGGMGVGLALVKRLVEMHGGTVAASSPGLGLGASFSVRLPAVPAASAGTDDDSPSVRTPVLPAARILVTEDNDDSREMMSAVLELDGHDVRVARNGAETLAILSEWLPDIVLMDIGLPDMEGYEVARRIVATDVRRRIGLIALTGYGQIDDERRAYDAGFDLHLVKPVSLQSLREALSAFMRENNRA